MNRHSVVAAMILALAAGAVISCSPKVLTQVRTEYQAVQDIQHDTVWRDHLQLVKEKGDTITIIEKEYIYKTLWKSRIDTCYVHDTTSIERIKEVKVEKDLNLVQKLKLSSFWFLLAALAFAYRKQLLRLILRLFAG